MIDEFVFFEVRRLWLIGLDVFINDIPEVYDQVYAQMKGWA